MVLFAVIFLINYLKSLHQIHAAQPIELLHGEQEGEREPKTKLLTAWIGLLCLGLGYYLALTCQNPMVLWASFSVRCFWLWREPTVCFRQVVSHC